MVACLEDIIVNTQGQVFDAVRKHTSTAGWEAVAQYIQTINLMRFLSKSNVLFLAAVRPRDVPPAVVGTRQFFNLLRKSKLQPNSKGPEPILSQDNLFHPFSKSPFPAVRARGEAVQLLAPCPVCASSHSHIHAHTKAQPRAVKFECPHCGWPTHCSEEHFQKDTEHQKYCSRLREANEDEHDLRSGRRLREFELPGPLTSNPLLLYRFQRLPRRPTGV
jgi:splicing suppressor protein 51